MEYMKSTTPENWEKYVKHRNEANVTVRTEKNKSWEKFGEEIELDYKENQPRFWKRMKALRGKFGKQTKKVI